MPASVYYELKEILLKIEGVSQTLGGRPILRDVNVEVHNIHRPGLQQGQVVAFLGPSGMGKTRLFRLIAGLDEPDTGRVLVGPSQMPVRRGTVGVVAQQYPLFAHRTIMGNLKVAGRQAGLSKAESQAKALELLERFGLADQANKYPSQISGGQRQRVAIVQQIICSDSLLLMDEPFSGLDVAAVDRVIRLINEMAAADEHLTIIVVTHDIQAALEVADTLWVLGRERDAAGEPIPGAKIVKTYNLIEAGLAWRENITRDPAFVDLNEELRTLFHTL